jgi:hypothetical protein
MAERRRADPQFVAGFPLDPVQRNLKKIGDIGEIGAADIHGASAAPLQAKGRPAWPALRTASAAGS